jgi:hypothetical protein
MRNLQRVLEQEYSLTTNLSGWVLSVADDISSDGRTIVGTGLNPDGNLEAWLVRLDRPLNTPEPATSAIVTAVLLAFAFCRRERRG